MLLDTWPVLSVNFVTSCHIHANVRWADLRFLSDVSPVCVEILATQDPAKTEFGRNEAQSALKPLVHPPKPMQHPSNTTLHINF